MASTTTPTLFGLTLQQVEGIRGYSETCAGLYQIEDLLENARSLGLEHVPGSVAARRSCVRQARRTEDSIQIAVKAETPFGEGARFAVAALAEKRAMTLEALAAAESEVS